MSFLRADIPRQTNNVLRIATVAAIDWEARQFRAQTGDITTNWLPFPAWISHNYRHWLPLRESAQIILTVDGGDYNTATVVGMLWSDDVPAPDIPVDDRPWIDRLEFEDGTRVEYDSKRQKLLIDTPGEITLRAKSVKIESTTLTHNGTNVGDTHTHPGVMPGGASTGTPQ
nr:MAG TPA: type VI secretion protein [Caudoviricetes sp.]